MPGIGIVTNPNSRRNRRFPEQMHRLGYILGKDDVYELTNQPQDIGPRRRGVPPQRHRHLALNGGDGTNHVTLTTFIEVYGDQPLPKIAFMRGGTMNTTSNAIGVHGTPGKILLNLVERYYTTQDFDITERDILKLTDQDGNVRYGFIFGNGIMANFLEVYYENASPSPTVAASLLARTIGSAIVGGEFAQNLIRPVTIELDLDGDVIPPRPYVSLAVSTIEQIGLGFRPFTRCEEKPGYFHLSLIKGKPTQLVSALLPIRLGQRPNPETMESRIAHRAVLRSDVEFGYTIDGDMHTARGGVLTIEAGPRLQIILA